MFLLFEKELQRGHVGPPPVWHEWSTSLLDIHVIPQLIHPFFTISAHTTFQPFTLKYKASNAILTHMQYNRVISTLTYCFKQSQLNQISKLCCTTPLSFSFFLKNKFNFFWIFRKLDHNFLLGHKALGRNGFHNEFKQIVYEWYM